MTTQIDVLDDPRYVYDGDDLGATYGREVTSFRLWAPTASAITLLLYDDATAETPAACIAMDRAEAGTWTARVPGDLAGRYYLYAVTIDDETHTAVDPYARAIAPNGTRGLVVDLPATDPAGWAGDRHVAPEHPTDAVIYELHVRDFSIDPASGMDHRGQYLAFTERGTTGPDGIATGLDYLASLGITHLQLMPVAAYASIDETRPGDGYNWGYDPRNYNTPTGAYATTPLGTARIGEFKRLVQSLHAAGIGVILDVVYNHTFAVGDSDFDKIVPRYYYRTDANGAYTNGSGVGNELATERPMVRKFVLDSLRYWIREYHVDGFRFDLMALLGTETLRLAADDLRANDAGILLYGEPWTGGASGLPGDELLLKGHQRGLGIGVFDDDLRNALAGSVFHAGERGFVSGWTGDAIMHAIVNGVKGSVDTFAAEPGEAINYVTSHDNYTLWDKLAASNAGDSEGDRILMDELAQAVVLTSQGVPFLQGGEEFLRTKGGNDNSYNAGDAVNRFDWARAARYRDVTAYYAGLIRLRRAHPAFRLHDADDVRAHLSFLATPPCTLAFTLSGHANGDPWETILVIYNPTRANLPLTLPDGTWTAVAWQGQAGTEPLWQGTGSIIVPPITCAILHS